MTPEEKDKILAANKARLDKLAKEAYDKLVRRIRDGEDPRDAIDAVMQTFPKKYATELSESFSAILGTSVGSSQVLAMEVSGLKLSQRLYNESRTVSASVVRLVNNHIKGFQDARSLALKIYEGYNFNLKESLSPRAQTLPRYLRRLISTPLLRNDINIAMTRIQASKLKTPALKASYLELIDKIQADSGLKALEKKLDVAFHEKMRYFSNRIAQTELHRAWSNQNTQELLADDDVEFIEIRLSATHKITDICDLFAKQNKYGLGPGIYPKKLAPQSPFHPFCRCRAVGRLDLPLGTKYKEIKGADRAFLRSQDGRDAARIMGSRAKLKSVLDGKDSLDVYNKHIDPFYRVKLTGGKPEKPLPVQKEVKPKAPPPEEKAYWNEETDAGLWHQASFNESPLFIKRAIRQVGDPKHGVKQTPGETRAFYSSHQGFIEMGTRTNVADIGTRGVWRHEYGHHADNVLGRLKGHSTYFSSTAAFKEAVKADANDLIKYSRINMTTNKRIQDYQLLQDKSKSTFLGLGNFEKRDAWLEKRYAAAGLNYSAFKETMKRSAAFPDMFDGIGLQDRYRRIIDAFDQQDFQALADAMFGGRQDSAAAIETSRTFKKGVLGNLSDLIGSATKNKVSGYKLSGYGHSDAYYKREGMLSYTEVFANLFDYYGSNNQEMIKIIERFLPNTSTIFKGSLSDGQ